MRHLFFFSIILIFCFSCEDDNSSANNINGGEGIAGSLARFITLGDYFYVIDDENLFVYDASEPDELDFLNSIYLGQGIETIFPHENYLFFGTNSGMLIYDNTDPANPQFVSSYQHIVACDPVTVKGNYAYVTLREQAFPGQLFPCTQGVSELQVVDISQIQHPIQVNAIEQENPIGLSTYENQLFVCDNLSGLHNYIITPNSPQLMLEKVYDDVKGHDLIISDNLMMVISNNQLNQFRFTPNGIEELSQIELL